MRSVSVVPYDPRWPGFFERESKRLEDALAGAVVAVEHIGSTAVPGLAAKPVIDLMVGVDSLGRGRSLIEPVERLGYTYVPELDSVLPERRFFQRRPDPELAPGVASSGYHVHLVEHGGVFWVDHLRFRDLLRGDRAAARRYSELKLELARRFPDDREAYQAGKEDLIRELLSSVSP